MLLKRILQNKTTYFYLIPALLATGALLIYSSDDEPPVISNFTITPKSSSLSDSGITLTYSGSLSDSRPIRHAQFLCKQGGTPRLQMYLGFTSNEANLVSFGIMPGSPSWQGSWEGTSENIAFQGTGRIPAGFAGTNCKWSVELRDILGNETTVELEQTTSITRG